MQAKIQRRTSPENYVPLGEALPLNTPFVLLIDPSNLCNLKCSFCPTGNAELIRSTGRYQGIMKLNLFKKIIDDLKEFNEPIKVLRLYKEGEPLINPYFSSMIKYAKDSGSVLRVDTTTNGLLLNKKLNRDIVNAGLDQINISVNGVSAEQKYTGVKINFERYCATLRDLYENKGTCEIYLKAIRDNLSEEEQTTFLRVFGDMADRVFLENLSPAWPGFDFKQLEPNLKIGHYGQPVVCKKVCPYIFYIMVINSDGTTSLCVGDWQHKLSYGNVKTHSVKAVWLGDGIKAHQIAHLTNRRSDCVICNSCQVISHGTIENIDANSEKILQRMINK